MNPECDTHKIKNCTICVPEVSDPDAKLENMVEQASVPTLASLFRKAKADGAIKPVSGYGNQPAATT
jgi:hypothetical protein